MNDLPSHDAPGAAALYQGIRDILLAARNQARRAVNDAMVQAYWQIGQLIVENEQGGRQRAEYGKQVLRRVATELEAEFGKGFSVVSLRNFRQFYLSFDAEEIRSTPWSNLTWSHYRSLMRIEQPEARRWYADEAAREQWSVRALDRQIGPLFHERLLSSQDKAGLREEARALITQQAGADPRDFIRDPCVLGYLGAQPSVCQQVPATPAQRGRTAR